ncbi:DUF3761 domain-containing protein [Kitasatospora paranensis]|uniref:DUF3761 domain-containing protein n=1 Tax=Kitasatospora paranensis TaxID=258053 RepID=A0ABW2FVL9_9ACTN
MTTQNSSRRLLPAAALLTLALFGAACDPETGAAAGPAPAAATSATGAASPAADPSTAAPAAAPSSAQPTDASPSATDPAPATTAAAPTTRAPATKAAPAPVHTTPAPARTTAKAAPTTKAPAGSCAHHTTGVCGWDVGLTPVSSSETAECNDGTVSYSATFSGTCSHHGGVRYWFK